MGRERRKDGWKKVTRTVTGTITRTQEPVNGCPGVVLDVPLTSLPYREPLLARGEANDPRSNAGIFQRRRRRNYTDRFASNRNTTARAGSRSAIPVMGPTV